MTGTDTEAQFAEANRLMREAYEAAPLERSHPTGMVQWVHIDQVQANDYNPNAVPAREMNLLYTSISEDGYTQPVVVIYDPEIGKYVVVDGYHRYTVMRSYADIAETTHRHLPVVVLDKSIADRIASTVRHNRARGKHSVSGMGNLVFQMLKEGEDDQTICRKIGVDAEELSRLKHVTGYSKLYADHTYAKATLTESQLKAKAEYKKENPNESIPQF